MSKWRFLPETEAVVADMLVNTKPIPGTKLPPLVFQKALIAHGKRLLNMMSLPMVPYECGLNFAKALAKPFRSGTGEALVASVGQFWVEWERIGLELEFAQALTSGLYCALTGRVAPWLMGVTRDA
jgi:hypothetical protein